MTKAFNRRAFLRTSGLLLTPIALAACGGGDSDDPSEVEDEFFAIDQSAGSVSVDNLGNISILQGFNDGSSDLYSISRDLNGSWLSRVAARTSSSTVHSFFSRDGALPAVIVDKNSGNHARVTLESGSIVIRIFSSRGDFITGAVSFLRNGRRYAGLMQSTESTSESQLLNVVDITDFNATMVPKRGDPQTAREFQRESAAEFDFESCVSQGLKDSVPSAIQALVPIALIIVAMVFGGLNVVFVVIGLIGFVNFSRLKDTVNRVVFRCVQGTFDEAFSSATKVRWSTVTNSTSDCDPPETENLSGEAVRVAEGIYRIGAEGRYRNIAIPGALSYNVTYDESNGETAETGEITIRPDGTLAGSGSFIYRDANPAFICTGAFTTTGRWDYYYAAEGGDIPLPA